jgi:hypothetical protein
MDSKSCQCFHLTCFVLTEKTPPRVSAGDAQEGIEKEKGIH